MRSRPDPCRLPTPDRPHPPGGRSSSYMFADRVACTRLVRGAPMMSQELRVRIGMVLANHPFPPDIRVSKEADALAAGGYDTLVLCRARATDNLSDRVGNAIAVRHSVHPGRTLKRRADSLRYLATLDSPSWRRAMVDLVRRHGAEALHIHDLPYARSGILAAREAGVPVVLDFHENYPAALALWKRRPIDSLMFSPKRAAKLERWAITQADRIVVVVDEAKERLVGLGADPDRIVVFGNTESLDMARGIPAPLDLSRGPRIVYVGGIAAHRGLDTVVAAMPGILHRFPNARLAIIGEGHTLPELKAQAHRLGVLDAIEFTGQLPKDEAMERVRVATLGLVPHHRSPHTDATVPHKLFQYMALGRPVLVSDCAPLARIVRATGAGDVFTAGEAPDLVRKVIALSDNEAASRAGAAGRVAVISRWNLEAEAPVLCSLYDELAAGKH
ncbi:MAG: hypothetical protein C0418_03040 [Coriobacteriaceae bacterium]|nr:hypothetical protein [Coriobacteriaceae bacterium]